MKELFQNKVNQVAQSITHDPRWDIQNELMTQVFAFTLFGYALGVGRLTCFLDAEDIQIEVIGQLTSLGVGPNYAKGLIEHAFTLFTTEDKESYHSQLIGIGHSHFASETLKELKESIFKNTEQLKRQS